MAAWGSGLTVMNEPVPESCGCATQESQSHDSRYHEGDIRCGQGRGDGNTALPWRTLKNKTSLCTSADLNGVFNLFTNSGLPGSENGPAFKSPGGLA